MPEFSSNRCDPIDRESRDGGHSAARILQFCSQPQQHEYVESPFVPHVSCASNMPFAGQLLEKAEADADFRSSPAWRVGT